jgi:hypothetical protein
VTCDTSPALADPPVSCDSQPVFSGRGRPVLAAAATALACALIPAATGIAGTPPNGLSAKGTIKFIFLKARVVSDGYVTPGQLETISISRMAPRARIKVFIEAPPTTLQCGELYFCDPAPTSPAPGTPPYRSSGNGKATLTFVTPSTYYIETDPFNPRVRQPVTFANGQSVHIDVLGASTRKRVRRESFGFARAIVQLPPS